MHTDLNKYNRENELKEIEAAKSDAALFAPIYNRYYKPIYLFIYNRLHNKQNTADLTAQVFLKAMLNLNKYEDRGFPFSSWLYRIALNEMNLLYRQSKKEADIEISEKDAMKLIEEVDAKYSDENIDLLLQILSEMNDEQQELIELRFFQKLSFKEIGEILLITEDNAKIKVYRVLEKMKSLFLEKYNNE